MRITGCHFKEAAIVRFPTWKPLNVFHTHARCCLSVLTCLHHFSTNLHQQFARHVDIASLQTTLRHYHVTLWPRHLATNNDGSHGVLCDPAAGRRRVRVFALSWPRTDRRGVAPPSHMRHVLFEFVRYALRLPRLFVSPVVFLSVSV